MRMVYMYFVYTQLIGRVCLRNATFIRRTERPYGILREGSRTARIRIAVWLQT